MKSRGSWGAAWKGFEGEGVGVKGAIGKWVPWAHLKPSLRYLTEDGMFESGGGRGVWGRLPLPVC